jgi:hypothetical protein
MVIHCHYVWFNRLAVEKVSNMAKLHAFYVTNAREEMNFIGHDISDDEFQEFMNDYTNSIDFDEEMFIDDILEDFNDEVIDLTQLNGETLEVEEFLNLEVMELTEELGESQNTEAESEAEDHGNLDFDVDAILNSSLGSGSSTFQGTGMVDVIEKGKEREFID